MKISKKPIALPEASSWWWMFIVGCPVLIVAALIYFATGNSDLTRVVPGDALPPVAQQHIEDANQQRAEIDNLFSSASRATFQAAQAPMDSAPPIKEIPMAIPAIPHLDSYHEPRSFSEQFMIRLNRMIGQSCTGDEVICASTVTANPADALHRITAMLPNTGRKGSKANKRYDVRVEVFEIQ